MTTYISESGVPIPVGIDWETWEYARQQSFGALLAALMEGRCWTYTEFFALRDELNISASSPEAAFLLKQLNAEEYRDNGLLISGLVVKRNTGRPGRGFFHQARALTGRPFDEGMWRNELRKLRAFYFEDDGEDDPARNSAWERARDMGYGGHNCYELI